MESLKSIIIPRYFTVSLECIIELLIFVVKCDIVSLEFGGIIIQ